MQFYGTLALILLLTLMFGWLSKKVGLPAVIGELLIGIFIGPGSLNWIQENNLIQVFSQLGVVILMFLAGLESDLKLLKRFMKPSVIVAVMGMVVPIIVAYVTGKIFGFSKAESLFLGITFAATSVSISVAVLNEMHQINSSEGTTILGAAVVDDVLAVMLLGVITNFVIPHSNNQPGLANNLVFQIGYFAFIFIFGHLIIPKIMNYSKKIKMPFSQAIMALVICLVFASLADLVNLSMVIGAFFAGIAIGQTPSKKIVSEPLEAVGYGVFIPVFFVSIGLQISFMGIFRDLALFITLSIGATLSKLIGAGVGAKISGFNLKSSLMIGSAMVSRGEMALVIAQLGLSNKLLSLNRYSAVIGTIILTTIIAPIMLRGTIKCLKP